MLGGLPRRATRPSGVLPRSWWFNPRGRAGGFPRKESCIRAAFGGKDLQKSWSYRWAPRLFAENISGGARTARSKQAAGGRNAWLTSSLMSPIPGPSSTNPSDAYLNTIQSSRWVGNPPQPLPNACISASPQGEETPKSLNSHGAIS